MAFDLLRQDGQELLARPYAERRALLENLFTGRALTAPWTLCPMTTDLATAREWGQDQKAGHPRSDGRRDARHVATPAAPHPRRPRPVPRPRAARQGAEAGTSDGCDGRPAEPPPARPAAHS
ncbi:hypothetical protein [Streptomyces virginiae]|uniref:hypothetical protein n=1 Tax=Streptomyces virginiae TaxID=1961 RepID=UPI003454F68E